MANTTIPNLPAAIALNGTEQIGAVQAGTSVRVTTGQIASLANGQGGNLPWAVSVGGTGQSSALTQYGVVYGSATTAMATTSAGATNYVLAGNTGGAPTFQSFLTLLTTIANALPTSLPGSPGVLWNNGGVISIS